MKRLRCEGRTGQGGCCGSSTGDALVADRPPWPAPSPLASRKRRRRRLCRALHETTRTAAQPHNCHPSFSASRSPIAFSQLFSAVAAMAVSDPDAGANNTTTNHTAARKKKVIIDTDPGIDDAIAIFYALTCPELDVIALTTIFGNVQTVTATGNALHLLEFAGREDIPVSEGCRTSLRGGAEVPVADFVHGSDGLGNTYPTLSDRKPIDTFAPDYLIQRVNEFPGEITIVALGPLTNLARAVEQDPTFAKKVGQIIILGGAFQVNGNVNPAAEANIYGDPEAADIVFTCGADILVFGINVTRQVYWTGQDLADLGASSSKFGKYIAAASHFYAKYHRESYDIDAIYLHDPATMVAAVDPSLMTFSKGAVRVQQAGICRGLTLFNNSSKVWHDPTDWCGVPPVKVAVAIDSERIASLLKERLTAPS